MIDFSEYTGDSNLAINTEGAAKYKELERECLADIEAKRGCKVFHTDITCGALIDGIMVKDEKIIGVFEHRCREESLSQIKQYGDLILSHHKFEAGVMLSKLMRVPFLFIIYFIADKKQYYFKITDEKGILQFPVTLMSKKTSKSINEREEKLQRNNVFLPFKYIKSI